MSDGAQNRMKVSREGIVLIKSFEGFRPGAVPHEDGGWVIGYGHRRSAREGLTVGEADAELLLQYDLIPVVATLNNSAAAQANQHQFDALASFALSVGVERFQDSEVFRRLTAGRPAEVADALLASPEPARADAGLRRRAAERALFVADPARPVALAELLAAPLPPPPPVEDAAETPVVAPDARAAAVAALLGEPTPETGPDASSGDESAEAPVLTPVFGPPTEPAVEAEPVAADESQAVEEAAVETAEPTPEADDEAAPEPEPEPVAEAPAPVAVNLAAAFQMQRYSPYAGSGFGALPTPPVPSDAAPALTPPALIETAEIDAAEAEPAPDDVAVATETPAEPAPEEVVVKATTEETPTEVAPVEAVTSSEDAAPEPASDPLHVAASLTAPPALVLTAPEEVASAESAREVWPAEARAPSTVDEAVLFEDDAGLSLGPVLRHEAEPERPAGFDWSGAGAFIVMSGVGLVSIGAALAAVRRVLADGDGGREFGLIAAALGVIGLITVGVSTWNLYLRLVRTERD